jgi:hypothetical protein
MPGFSNITGDESIVYANNVSFDGTERGGKVTLDGQLLIGSSIAPHIRPALLTSTGSSINITNGHGFINLEAGTSIPTSFITNSGTATPSGTILNELGTGSITISGSGNTTTTALTGLTNHAVLVGAGTATITKVGPSATAGQVLQSGGASADPSYSTPTYPSASGTARKILVSDATNNVYSTETWAVPGTSLNLLQSDGTNWTSAAPLILTKTVTLTSAQIKAIHGTPVEIIAAPGSGKGIILINAAAKFIYGGTNVFVAAASQTIGLFLNNNTSSILTGINYITNSAIVGTANLFSPRANISNSVLQAAGIYDNVNIAAYNSVATEITGNAANDNSIDIIVTYQIITF